MVNSPKKETTKNNLLPKDFSGKSKNKNLINKISKKNTLKPNIDNLK